jgi:diadenosine tetraphosphatase ApaH/serine/threonine PP2A family protein phosphatase
MISPITDYQELMALSPEEFRAKLRENIHLDEHLLVVVFDRISSMLYNEPNVLFLQSPITVCGDIHGQMLDLFQLFKVAGDDLTAERYLFLGDYVDRGYSSIETFVYLAYLKLKYPGHVYLLRGNHESRTVNQQYGLYNDCLQLYGHAGIWFQVNEVFDCLPVAAVVDRKIFCVHGGLSPAFGLIEQIYPIERKRDIDDGVIADLTWSDPEEVTKYVPNRRGNGQLFGPQQTRFFLRNNRLGDPDAKRDSVNHGFIARSHQLAQTGHTWMHNDDLVIVWSAPNYSYKSGNEACVMKVFPDKPVEFVMFDKDENSHIKPVDLEISYFA